MLYYLAMKIYLLFCHQSAKLFIHENILSSYLICCLWGDSTENDIIPSFIALPDIQNTTTNSHYTQCNCRCYHTTFLAKTMKDFSNTTTKGISGFHPIFYFFTQPLFLFLRIVSQVVTYYLLFNLFPK